MLKKLLIALAVITILPSTMAYSMTGYPGVNFVTPFWFGLELESDEDASNKEDVNFSVYRLGYTASNGLYLGLFLDRFKYQNDTSADHNYQAYGPSIGYAENGWFMAAHLILESRKKVHHLGEYRGSGFGAAGGYSILVSEQISLGVQLTFRANHYDKLVAPTGNSNTKHNESNFMPLVVLGTSFN